METVLQAKDLCKTYIINKKQNHVLRNINFELGKGEYVAVMGPSGSGKSTLLYTISGMDDMTEGQVEFLGQKINGLKQNELSDLRLNAMGFVFQQMHMLRNLTVYDNIIVSAYQSKRGKTRKQREVINRRASELMRKMDIMDIANQDITEVSGGQLQRACICRALINDPKILFADEPTGALNSKASNEVMAELTRLNKEGMTILLITHDIKVAARTDKILYLVDGNIEGQCQLGKFTEDSSRRERENKLSNWLLEMGW